MSVATCVPGNWRAYGLVRPNVPFDKISLHRDQVAELLLRVGKYGGALLAQHFDRIAQDIFDVEHLDRYHADNGKLMGRLVLITPIALGTADWETKRLDVALTRDQVKNSPDIMTDQPVSRQREVEYFRYYNYPVYWGGPGLWGAGMYPTYPGYPGGVMIPPENAIHATERERQRPPDATSHGDPHLRSTREVLGYNIQARDGEIGHVKDFIVDDATWAIRYMVIDTRNWWPGKKVLVAPQWLEAVDWANARVAVDLTRDAIKRGPEYDPSNTKITR